MTFEEKDEWDKDVMDLNMIRYNKNDFKNKIFEHE